MSSAVAAVIASAAAAYAGLVSSLVLLYVRTLRSSYDSRVADLKEHNAEMLKSVREQQALDRLRADSLDKVLASTQTMEALMRALPRGGTETT